MAMITVNAMPEEGGWTCDVRVEDDDGSTTEHEVTVSSAALEHLAPGAAEPTDLVRRSFEFLLARESKGSILRRFDIRVIGRYFPEYEAQIGHA
jgi:hypothetical protein